LRRAWTGRWRLIRDRLVSSNLGLVYSTVQRFSGHGSDGDDALSDALYALLCAVERFNPWRGFRFSTYACNCIVRSVLRHRQREQRHRERFPAYYDPDFERPSEEPDDRGSLVLDRLHRVMAANGGELTPLESSILAQRFPLREEGRLTFAAIGRRIGLSKERVRQIQNAALLKLRWALEADPLLG
jgi:RNA polymerase sigma factor (sigma-70 family)